MDQKATKKKTDSWIDVKADLGADNTGTTDASTIINNAITTYGATNLIYIPKGDYLLSSPILVSNNYTKIICEGTLKINGISAIKLTVSYCDIYIKRISSSNNGAALETGGNFVIMHNNVTISVIETCTDGFLLNPDGNNGVQYCRFTFDWINNCTNGVHFKSGANSTPWINENQFYGGRLSGTNGILIEKGQNQTDPYNGNKFFHFGFETIVTPITLNFCNGNVFENFRMSESITGTYYFVVDPNSGYNTFLKVDLKFPSGMLVIAELKMNTILSFSKL